MRRDAHNVRKTLKKVQNASRMYVLDMCGYKKWVLQPQFTYRQPPQAHSAHSNMGGSEALTIKGGLDARDALHKWLNTGVDRSKESRAEVS